MKNLMFGGALSAFAVGAGSFLYLDEDPLQKNRELADKVFAAHSIELPAVLPEAVAARIGSVLDVSLLVPVEFHDENGLVVGRSSEYISAGSAVNIAPGIIASAGHLLFDDFGNPESRFDCGDLSLKTGSLDGTGTIEASVLHSASSDNPDIAIYIPSQDSGFSALPGLPIADTPPKPGDALFFINYQQTPDGEDRTLGAEPMKQSLSSPAMYGGVMIDSSPDGQYQVVTGQQNYGRVAETESSPGSSGGPVFNQEGELVGLVASREQGAVVEYIDSRFGEDTEWGLSKIEPLDEELVARLQAEAIQSPRCEPTIDTHIVTKV